MKKLLILAGLVYWFGGSCASAAVPQMIGDYDDWVAYYYRDQSGPICYMASAPKKDEGKYSKRGDIFVVITHRPNEKSFDVFNINAGYDYKPDSKVEIKIGTKTFDRLFVSKDKAWAVSEKVDKEIVEAMKKGSRMMIHGVSARGTRTKDTYSLAGFTSAYKAISNKCKKK